VLEEGAQIVADPNQPVPMTMIGWVSSSYWSENCGRRSRWRWSRTVSIMGKTLYVPMPDGTIEVEVRDTVFIDKEGVRLNG
jgi:sarcosine oxidase subunit alpha